MVLFCTCSVAPFYWQFYFINKFIESSVIEKLWPLEKQEIVFVAYLYYSQTSLNRSKWTFQNIKVSIYLSRWCPLGILQTSVKLTCQKLHFMLCLWLWTPHETELYCLCLHYNWFRIESICVSDVVVDLRTNIIWLILSVYVASNVEIVSHNIMFRVTCCLLFECELVHD